MLLIYYKKSLENKSEFVFGVQLKINLLSSQRVAETRPTFTCIVRSPAMSPSEDWNVTLRYDPSFSVCDSHHPLLIHRLHLCDDVTHLQGRAGLSENRFEGELTAFNSRNTHLQRQLIVALCLEVKLGHAFDRWMLDWDWLSWRRSEKSAIHTQTRNNPRRPPPPILHHLSTSII